MRNLKKIFISKQNPLWNVYRFIRFPKVLKNTLIIEICRYLPNLQLKRWVYVHLLKMQIGTSTAFAFKVVPDLFYPENIKIGNNCVVGYNTTLLTHEITINEYRTGHIIIGNDTLIGANTTILPGVEIGDHVVVAAGTVVSKSIPSNSFAYGNPIQIKLK